MCSDPETPEPVVEALERIAGGNIVPDEGGTVADEMREIARQALASLTDEPREQPMRVGSLAANLSSLRTYIEVAQEKPDDPRSLRYALNVLDSVEAALPTPVPQGLVERIERIHRDMAGDADYWGSFVGDYAMGLAIAYRFGADRLRAALDTPTESVSESEVRELREAVEKMVKLLRDARQIGTAQRVGTREEFFEFCDLIADVLAAALAPDPEGGTDG